MANLPVYLVDYSMFSECSAGCCNFGGLSTQRVQLVLSLFYHAKGWIVRSAEIPNLLHCTYIRHPPLLPADAPEELKVDFLASQEAAKRWKVRAAQAAAVK
jgi:hypothetical protein